MTPLKVSIMGTSFAILLIINTFNPTGGVIKPTSTTTKVKIPNQMAVSSEDNPKSSDITKGKKTGIVNNIIAKLSIKQPNKRYKIIIHATTIKGSKLFSLEKSVNKFGS